MTREFWRIFVSWDPRDESPAKVGGRMQRSVDALAEINPLFRAWQIHDAAKELRDESRRMRESGEEESFLEPSPSLRDGFMFKVMADPDVYPEDATLSAVSAGEKTPPGYCGATLSIPLASAEGVVSYAAVRQMMLSLAWAWEAWHVQVRSSALQEMNEMGMRTFAPSWMTWLAPSLAKLVTPPPEALVEHLDGALLMSATRDVFDTDNLDHLKVCSSILGALAPINVRLGQSPLR